MTTPYAPNPQPEPTRQVPPPYPAPDAIPAQRQPPPLPPGAVYPAPPPLPPRPHRARHRWLYTGLGLATALALLMLIVGLMATTPATPPRVTGTLTLMPNLSSYTYGSSYGGYSSSSPCSTAGTGYSDITSGASVVIRDAEGRIAGIGELGVGQPSGGTCVYPFDVDHVERSDYYSVEVSHRGEISFTAEQVATNGVRLSLGG